MEVIGNMYRGAGMSIFVSGDGGMYDCSVSRDPVLVRAGHAYMRLDLSESASVSVAENLV
jgi:hypothetical protein